MGSHILPPALPRRCAVLVRMIARDGRSEGARRAGARRDAAEPRALGRAHRAGRRRGRVRAGAPLAHAAGTEPPRAFTADEERHRAGAEERDPGAAWRRGAEPSAAHAARVGSARVPPGRSPRGPSSGEAVGLLPRSDAESVANVALAHAIRAETEQIVAESRGLIAQRRDLDALATGW